MVVWWVGLRASIILLLYRTIPVLVKSRFFQTTTYNLSLNVDKDKILCHSDRTSEDPDPSFTTPVQQISRSYHHGTSPLCPPRHYTLRHSRCIRTYIADVRSILVSSGMIVLLTLQGVAHDVTASCASHFPRTNQLSFGLLSLFSLIFLVFDLLFGNF